MLEIDDCYLQAHLHGAIVIDNSSINGDSHRPETWSCIGGKCGALILRINLCPHLCNKIKASKLAIILLLWLSGVYFV